MIDVSGLGQDGARRAAAHEEFRSARPSCTSVACGCFVSCLWIGGYFPGMVVSGLRFFFVSLTGCGVGRQAAGVSHSVFLTCGATGGEWGAALGNALPLLARQTPTTRLCSSHCLLGKPPRCLHRRALQQSGDHGKSANMLCCLQGLKFACVCEP